MAAYVVMEIEVHDPVLYEDYKKLSTPALTRYGGRFIVRGGQAESYEGEWHPQRLVIAEFASIEKVKEWWDSPEYREARAIRQRASTARMVVLPGV